MYQKFGFIFLIIFLITSCSKNKNIELNIPPDKNESFETYKEAVDAMDKGDFFYAAKNFLKPSQLCLKLNFLQKLH